MREKQEILPIKTGEHFLQDVILRPGECYICGTEEVPDEMALLRIDEHKMALACLKHRGVVQEFIKQYKRPPLEWEIKEYATNTSKSEKDKK